MIHYDAILPAPFGAVGVRVGAAGVSGLDFLPPGTTLLPARDDLSLRAEAELAAYYADPQHVWDLPLTLQGTSFRQRVWRALCSIPAGSTRSYGDIARELDSSPRAVGQAVGDNPIPIVVPCHRVLAAHGGMGGFMHGREAFPLAVKGWLLGHEGVLPRAGGSLPLEGGGLGRG